MERDRYRGEPSSRFSQSPWNRPPPRSFNPRGINGRARTPSPGATYGHREPRSVDVRDRLDLDTRGGPSRAGWDHERERRWNGRDERFGDESRSMPNRRPSPTKAPYRERQASPGRWRSTSIPRNGPPPGRPPFAQRERDWERDRDRERDRPGSGQGPPGVGSNRESGARSPGPSAYPISSRERDRPFPAAAVSRPEAGAVSTRSSPGATSNGAARSVRGTSSPVMSRMPDSVPSSTAAAAPTQSDEVKSEPEEGELEEGEVLSPVRPQRDPVREPVDGTSSSGWNRSWPRRSPPPPPTTNGGGIGHGRKPSNVPMPRGYRGRPPHVNGGDRDRDRERDRQWGQRQISPTKGPVDNGWDGFARRRVSAEEPGLGKAGQERSPLKSQREESPLINTEENRLPDAQAVSEATTEPGADRLREKDAAIARVAKAEPAVGSAESDLVPLQVTRAESPPIVRDQKAMAEADGVSAVERSHWEGQGIEGHGRDEAARMPGRDDEQNHTGSDTGSQAQAKPEPILPIPDTPKHVATQQMETPPQTADGPIQLSEQEDDRPPTPERPPTPPLPAILDESEPDVGNFTPAAAESSVETVPDCPVVAQLHPSSADKVESAKPVDSTRQPGFSMEKEVDGVVTETATDGKADDGRPEAAQTWLPPAADSNNNLLEDIAVQAGLVSNGNFEPITVKDVDMEDGARTVLQSPDEAKPAAASADATTAHTPAQPEPASLKPVSTGSDRTQANPESSKTAQDAETSSATRLPARRPRETRTLAERRSVQLPPTSGPLPATMQSDALPTAVSAVDSTDTEIWPEAVEVAEEVRDANIIASMKTAQMRDLQVDAEAIMAWNVEVSPVKSCRRVLTPKELKSITRSLDKGVSRRVAMQIAKEHVHNERRVERLREEYLTLDKDWQEHCRYLDELMELRGPPPESLYSIPNALPAVTPGPMPGTPATEEVGGRSRRRGALADAVNTEAEYQEILASFADTAAKDPNARALKTTAVVPDMLTPKERLMRHVDENDLVEDPLAFYDFDGLAEPVWTQEEEDIFKRRYLNYPKQFGKIADGIPTKSAGDCVLYYYRTKKEKNWKGQLAVRRGMSTLKRKAPLIKKGGKSAALLANLDAKKPTVDPTPVKPTANKEKDGAETPTDKAGKRKPKDARRKSTLDTPGAETDEVSEMKKIKGKAKRPRSSAVPDQSVINAHALANAARGAGLAGEASTSADPATTELLPPVKRRKHRKVQPEVALGPDGQPVPAEDKPVKPKRGGNSYWTVPEKARCKELAMTYKTDYKTIASFMPDKTERQVINHMKDYLVEWKLVGPDVSPLEGLREVKLMDKGEKLGGPYSRSIYDVYNGANGPRLGVFPPLPRPDSHQATTSAHPLEQPSVESRAPPVQEAAPIHISRPGGMRISALLNDDPAPPAPARVDNTDNQSDATVDDTEDPRRSPRAYPTHAPSHVHTQQHDDPYAHAHAQGQPQARPGDYRSVSGGSVQYYRTSQTPHQQHVYDPHARERVMHYSEEPLQRAQTATPAYRYEYPHDAYPERAYSGHARVPPHSDAYQAMIAERAYNRANVAVDYRSPQPPPTYDERYYEERSRQERTYAAAAAMPPLHHPQPHLHSHMQPHAHSHPPQHTHLQAHPQAHPQPQPQPHSHSAHHHQTLPPARPPSAHSHAPSISPHISHSHVPQVAHHMSPHTQAGMVPRRSPYEPERNSERLPSIHPGMDEQRRA